MASTASHGWLATPDGDAGERHDVAMQVGLVGIAALGRDSGGVFTSGQAVAAWSKRTSLAARLGRQADIPVVGAEWPMTWAWWTS
jgi:hypothetical protein